MTMRYTHAFKKKKRYLQFQFILNGTGFNYNYDLQTTEYLFCFESII